MRKILGASILMFMLCCPAFAGDITCPSAPAPPSAVVEETTGHDEGETQAADSFTETVLNLLGSVLALL